MSLALLLLLLPPLCAAGEAPVLQEDITIRGKAARGPGVRMPGPAADAAVVQEVVGSLGVLRPEAASRTVKLPLQATARRLARPFPQPPFLSFTPSPPVRCERWTFAVRSGSEVLWRTEGAGVAGERLEWDGTGPSGEMAARAGGRYGFRFTCLREGLESVIESEEVDLPSLAFREFIGEQRLEVSNGRLFLDDGAALGPQAEPFLAAMADRMRRVAMPEGRYQLILYQPQPRSGLARRRARAVARALAQKLVISPSQIEVDLQTAGRRGDAAVCVLPPEQGASVRLE